MTASEAACLEALRAGAARKVLIALRAGLNVRQTNAAIGSLASLGLVVPNGQRTWHLTPRGEAAEIVVAPAARGRRSRTVSAPGPGAARLLALLDRPRHGADLPALLGVTRQRVHQLVIALSALGLVRSADPSSPTFVIARKDDRSSLLSQDQERLLSAFLESNATTLSKVTMATGLSCGRVAASAEDLCAAALVETTGTAPRTALYRLTLLGLAHWQRSATARQAEVPPPPFRSDRVRDVLSLLGSQGPTRTRDLGLALGIEKTSMNALMQYLKRKSAVRTQSDVRFAPYDLTLDGRDMLAAMQRRARNHAPI
jgi:predicted transcriptional regulator